MYVPAHFTADDAAVARLLARPGLCELVTAGPDGLRCTPLPMVFDADAGPHGALLGHVARNNDHWRQHVDREALVVVRGVDAYVSPSWYASKAEHGRVVPTWNYETVHAHGRFVVHDDVDWLAAQVRRLTAQQEADRAQPWHVDDAPARYVEGQLRAIVGVEVVLTRVEAKAKLSQNRSAADVAGVVAGLEDDGEGAAADAVRAAEAH